MPQSRLNRYLMLPELEFAAIWQISRSTTGMSCVKTSTMEVCPKCATPSRSIYDHREATVKDAPIRGKLVVLKVRKRRFWCRPCKLPFTEPVPGIRKGKRHTERFERAVRWACDNFKNLKQVRREFRISAKFLYQAYYRQLELRRRTRLSCWPKTIGIDEHSFRRHPEYGHTEYVSMIVDFTNKRVKEVVEGKTSAALEHQLAYIAGRENVANVVIDMCDPFKNFARSYFPNARIVADKFHVLRLLSPSLMRRRKEIVGTRATMRARRLLLMSSKKLDYAKRAALKDYLWKYPELRELYEYKEKLHSFYRIKGYHQAAKALRKFIDNMSWSLLPEIRTLRRTLIKWREEILNYFLTGLTNARTEGFNNKAKVVKRMAYGYKSFKNYRLRVLDACA
jgi:transposase